MCGLIATVGEIDQESWDLATSLLMHRGYRDRTIEAGCGKMFHRRLPIVGLDVAYDQPVETKDWIIGFVGEILGFRDLNPSMACDTELVVDTWESIGPVGFNPFDGFWHVVAIDKSTMKIHGLVDYLAQKPLYYRLDVPTMASELAAIAAVAPTEPDWVYLSSCIKWGYCPETSRTPYQEVRRVLPGEHVVIDWDSSKQSRIVNKLHPRQSTSKELRQAISDAVRRRVVSSDVPVACLTSGGIDSSIVYYEACKYSVISPYHVENGEKEWCDKIAPEAKFVPLDSVAPGKDLEYMQEPLDLGSLVPQIAASDAIRKNSDLIVCLTGDGADEMFGGYGRAQRYDSQASDVWQELVAYHLPRLDRVMMRNQIEVRSPYLAKEVCEIALGLPRPHRISKSVLKEAYFPVVHPDILFREKKPLRTRQVEEDRESRSKELVQRFVESNWRKVVPCQE